MNPLLDAAIAAILRGDFDEDLDKVSDACHNRKRQTAYAQLHALRPGDRVEFIEGRPRYLIGAQATVVDIMQTYASLRLDQDIGKFSARGTIRTPMTCIRKVNNPAN